MEHGKLFIEEHPDVGDFFERLLIHRELDDWYREKCAEEAKVPEELYCMEPFKNVELRNRMYPSFDIYLFLKPRRGEEGFYLQEQISLKVSKLLPVYIMDFSYSLRHQLIKGTYEMTGTPESLELIQGSNQIHKMMSAHGYTELSYLYDFYDTVYEWDKLSELSPFNRRLTLGDAVFTDVLELCESTEGN